MASLLTPRRNPSGRSGSGRSGSRQDDTIRLTATMATDDVGADPQDETLTPKVGWLVMAVTGALIIALSGWVILAGLTVLGWLAGDAATLGSALRVGTQLWLLANGAGAQLGSLNWTLTPLGVSLVFAFMISRFAGLVARQYVAEHPGVTRLRVVGSVTVAMAVAYLLLVAGTGLAVGLPIQAARGVVGGVLIAGTGAAWGSARTVGFRPTERWPGWIRPIPVAVASAQGVILLAGAAALISSLIVHLHRVVTLTDGLHAGVAGGIAILIGQLVFAPNAVIWSGSYALGAGFTLGNGTVVAPAATTVGLLPPFPVLAAVPADGVGGQLQLCWLAAGVLAGAVAAVQVIRRRPTARFDETALVGGLSGVIAALAFVALGWLSGGDLGDARLAGLGPRLLPLLVLSAATLGLSGMLCGLIVGLIRRLRHR